MTVKINDAEIELKNTFRAMIVYEGIQGKSFQGNGITELITYFYSVVFANAPELGITFDTFVDWLDENPERLTEFVDWLGNIDKTRDQFDKKQQKKRTAKKTEK